MKLFYRVEFYFHPQWNVIRFRAPGAHNFARLSQYHDTLESAREHLATRLLIDEAVRKEKPWTPPTQYRITDHLGAIYWPEEKKAA